MTRVIETLTQGTQQLSENIRAGHALTREEGRALLRTASQEVPALLSSAWALRQAAFGRRIKLNYLINLQSGLCPEDCAYCTQSRVSKAPIEKYRFLSPEEVVDFADRGVSYGAARICLVASLRGPSESDLAKASAAIRAVREKYPLFQVCASLGLIDGAQARSLKELGVCAYNHNLNTSESHYGQICSTHAYAHRVRTVEAARQAGLSPCSGVILGLGESEEDILDVAFALKSLDPHSVPVNFLVPSPGTSLENHQHLTPLRCLVLLAFFRFMFPRAELRIAGGRQLHLRSLQPLGLMIANSIFIGDYLTTQGQPPTQDLEMIRDLGLEIEGAASSHPPAPLSTQVVWSDRSRRHSL